MNNHDDERPRGSDGAVGPEGSLPESEGQRRQTPPTERLAYPDRDVFPYVPQLDPPSRFQPPASAPAPDEASPQAGAPGTGHAQDHAAGPGGPIPPRGPEGGAMPDTGPNPRGAASANLPPNGQMPNDDYPWSRWEQAQAPAPQKKKRNGPGWASLIAVGLIAALLGGVLGVGVMNARWVNARPAATPTTFTSGTTDIVETDGAAPDWSTVASAVSGSVVAIDVSLEAGASAGSGFVIDGEGHTITNEHVVAGATAVFVTLHDGRVYEADIVGVDESTDLAVIKLVSPPDDLTVARFGDSSDVIVGDPVAAIGNPLGLSSTMTTGIVSALDRPVQTITESENADATRVITNAIQIDAAVNPGNSGGPVFDESGRVIGVASSIASLGGSEGQVGSIGLGFAIPSNLAQRVAGELIDNGVAEHAFLGVSIVDGIGNAQGTSWTGAQVRVVERGTPAEMSGLQVGDVVLQVNGRDVSSALALTGYVRQFASGDVITLMIVRNGELLEVDVTLATRAD